MCLQEAHFYQVYGWQALAAELCSHLFYVDFQEVKAAFKAVWDGQRRSRWLRDFFDPNLCMAVPCQSRVFILFCAPLFLERWQQLINLGHCIVNRFTCSPYSVWEAETLFHRTAEVRLNGPSSSLIMSHAGGIVSCKNKCLCSSSSAVRVSKKQAFPATDYAEILGGFLAMCAFKFPGEPSLESHLLRGGGDLVCTGKVIVDVAAMWRLLASHWQTAQWIQVPGILVPGSASLLS